MIGPLGSGPEWKTRRHGVTSYYKVLQPYEVGPICILFRLSSDLYGGEISLHLPPYFELPDPDEGPARVRMQQIQ